MKYEHILYLLNENPANKSSDEFPAMNFPPVRATFGESSSDVAVC
jgi:hypothetical protein